jgi:tetratricopeptide (TPR) repeat protein
MKTMPVVLKKVAFLFLFSAFYLPSFSQTYSSYNDLAKDAYDKKNYNLSIEYCNKSLNIQANGWAYWERGISYYNLYQYSQSISDYQRALPYYTDYKSMADLYCNIANSYMNDFKYQDAIDNYTKGYNYNYYDLGKLYNNRAWCFYSLGKYTEAEKDYSSASSYFSTDPKTLSDIYYYRAVCRNKLSNSEGAMQDFDKAIDTDPGNTKVYEKRASVWENKKEYQHAIDEYSKAINFMGSQVLSSYFIALDYKSIARCYYNLQHYDQAISNLESAVKADSTVSTWWEMGTYEHAGGFNEKAIAAYTKEVSLITDTASLASLHRNIALCYRDKLDYNNAISEVNKSISLKLNYGMAYWTKAMLLDESKLYQKSLEEYNKAILLFADNKSSLATIYKEMGDLYFIKLKDVANAAELFNKALALDSTNETILYEYGRFMVLSKNNPADGITKLKTCAFKDCQSDTSSTYSYALFFSGDKEAAFKNMWRMLDKYRDDKYRYKWELHVVACLYALSNNAGKAIEYQEKSFKAGFNDFNHLLNDKDLIFIQNLPEYKTVLVKYNMPVPKYYNH